MLFTGQNLAMWMFHLDVIWYGEIDLCTVCCSIL